MKSYQLFWVSIVSRTRVMRTRWLFSPMLLSLYFKLRIYNLPYTPNSHTYVSLCRRTRCSKLTHLQTCSRNFKSPLVNREYTRTHFTFKHFGCNRYSILNACDTWNLFETCSILLNMKHETCETWDYFVLCERVILVCSSALTMVAL